MGRIIAALTIGLVVVFGFSFYWIANAESLLESMGMGWWLGILVGAMVVLPLLAIFVGVRSSGKTASFMGSGKRAKQIQIHGIPAMATVLSIGDSRPGRSITINDQPFLRLVLRIEDRSREPYEATVDTIIPHYALAQFQPGARFAVRVDREDPQAVVLAQDDDASAAAGLAAESVAGSTPTIVAEGWSQTDLIKLDRDGRQGIARVVAAAATGRFEGENPIEQIDYEILLPGEEPYSVSKSVGLPAVVIPQIESTIGKSYPVTVHPDDPQKIKVAFTF